MKPKLKIRLTPFDKITEALSWVILLTSWIIVIIHYTELPDIIPIHYNGAGVTDNFGHKSAIWGLLSAVSTLFIGMTVINGFPQILNYPVTITAENALREYTLATKIIRLLKFALTVVFGMIILQTLRIGMNSTEESGIYFTTLSFILISAPLIYYFVSRIKSR